MLAWLIAHGKLNTCDLIQRRGLAFIFLLTGVLCVKVVMNRWTIYFCLPSLWARISQVAGIAWGNYVSCGDMLGDQFNFFGGKRRGVVLGILRNDGSVLSSVGREK